MNAHANVQPARSPRRSRLVLWILMSFAAFYLVAEHRAHLAGLGRWLPLLILLACPLLHLFGHSGHAGHEASAVGANDSASKELPLATESIIPPEASAQSPRPHTRRGDLP
jgi:hypothetical protein